MTEGIKEILELFAFTNDDCMFCDEIKLNVKESKLLLNYITNLQKEKQSLKEKLNCKEYFSSTMPENTEFVILTKENYDRQQKDLALENIILKSRNEKAIEWCECVVNAKYTSDKLPNGKTTDMGYCLDLAEPLLNILKGGDE